MRKLKDRTHINLGGESLTEQSHANDVDINQIMAKALRGQHSDYIRDHEGSYGDTSSLTFYEANIIVANANSMFEELPAVLRNRFKNNPANFLDYVQDKNNLEEMYKLKLATRPENTEENPLNPTPSTPAKTEAIPTETPKPEQE